MHTYYLSHELRRRGMEVTVFCGGRKSSTTVESDGLEVHRFPFTLIDIPPNFVWFQLQNLRRFIRFLGDFDLVHSQQSSGTAFSFLKKKLDLPWMVSFHGSWSKTQMQMVFRSLSLWDYGDVLTYVLGLPVFHALTQVELRLSDARVACSETLARELSSDYSMRPSDFHVISNGIDVDFCRSRIAASEGSVNRDPTLFFCGRLYKVKGIAYLMDAIKILKRRYPRIKLKILGRGPLRRSIIKYVKANSLEQNVEVLGYVQYSRLVDELVKSDLAVFPSLWEAQSIAMLEAMACAKPIVAFDFPFSQEIIRQGATGLLARPMDSSDLASCISKLLENADLRKRMGENARAYVSRYHSWTTVGEKYLSVYQALLS